MKCMIVFQVSIILLTQKTSESHLTDLVSQDLCPI